MTGRVRIRSATRCTNPILHSWLKEELAAIVAALPACVVKKKKKDEKTTRAAWQVWQEGLIPSRIKDDPSADHKTG